MSLNIAEDDLAFDKAIASMLIIGFEGHNTQDTMVMKITNYLADEMLGGVILFKRNIDNPQQLKSLTSNFIKANPDIFITVDQEGGKVQRLTPAQGFKGFLSPAKVAQLPVEEARAIYEAMALELNNHGINLNFAPVVDINNASNPCPVIGPLERSYGEEATKIVQYSEIFIDAHHKNKVLTSIKHFPGHGLATKDSHLGLVDVTDTAKEEELLPFYQLIDKGKADMIMTAHLINRNLDPEGHPATLSPIILKSLLADRLDKTLIIGDDLHMGAIASYYNFEDSIIKAINAGCNLIIFSNNPLACKNIVDFKPDYDIPSKFIMVVKKAIAEGKLNLEDIHKSAEKIKALKAKLKSLA